MNDSRYRGHRKNNSILSGSQRKKEAYQNFCDKIHHEVQLAGSWKKFEEKRRKGGLNGVEESAGMGLEKKDENEREPYYYSSLFFGVL